LAPSKLQVHHLLVLLRVPPARSQRHPQHDFYALAGMRLVVQVRRAAARYLDRLRCSWNAALLRRAKLVKCSARQASVVMCHACKHPHGCRSRAQRAPARMFRARGVVGGGLVSAVRVVHPATKLCPHSALPTVSRLTCFHGSWCREQLWDHPIIPCPVVIQW